MPETGTIFLTEKEKKWQKYWSDIKSATNILKKYAAIHIVHIQRLKEVYFIQN
jgi:hypothetical protein